MLQFHMTEYGKKTGWSYDDMFGFLPTFFYEQDPRPASEQLNERYAHGGGWNPNWSGKYKFDPVTHTLKYPGDPLFKPLGEAELHGDKLYFYNYAILAIVHPDGSFEVDRID